MGIADQRKRKLNCERQRRQRDRDRLGLECYLLQVDDIALAEALIQSGRLSEEETQRRPDGIFIAPFEQGEIGPDLFRAACGMGLEGLVSKRRDRPYQAGRSKHWVKIKNRKHPAMSRVMEAFA
jgi:hypothetical protein